MAPLPFLSRKKRKQKKVECGTAFLLRSCCFRQHAAQNGRFVCEPSVFPFQVGRAENLLSSEKHPSPLCLLFLFFKKRNRSPFLFFLERKGRKESRMRNSFPSLLLLLPSTCCTKRTVHIRTVRFFVPCAGRAGKPPFLRKTSAPAVSFVSFLQEKKSFPYPFLSRKKRKKRKSIAEQLSFFAPAASVNMLHKTDGSNANRPFFRSK